MKVQSPHTQKFGQAPSAVTAIRLQSLTSSRLRRCALSLPPGDRRRAHPRRVALGAPSIPPNRQRRIGPASAPPRWAGRWQTRRDLLRQVVRMRAVLDAGGSCPSRSRRTVHGQRTRHRYGASTPRLKTGTAECGGGVLACHGVVDLARVSGRAGAAFVRGCRAGPISIRGGSSQGVLVLS